MAVVVPNPKNPSGEVQVFTPHVPNVESTSPGSAPAARTPTAIVATVSIAAKPTRPYPMEPPARHAHCHSRCVLCQEVRGLRGFAGQQNLRGVEPDRAAGGSGKEACAPRNSEHALLVSIPDDAGWCH